MLDLSATDPARHLGHADPVTRAALDRALAGAPISDEAARHLIALSGDRLAPLLAVAGHVRTRTKGRTVTYSPKVFLPITNLCYDCCSYCTFRKPPESPHAWTMLPEEVRRISIEGRALGCTEALLCLGDHPERAFPSYRSTLASLGCASTIDYVERCCAIAFDAGLLPHTNAGVLTKTEMQRLKPLNASMGLMIETVSPRLRQPGGPHANSPDKDPALRLAMLRAAGELQIPFTTGILIGIGETRHERVASLRAIGDLDDEFGHVQEIIVQNFRAKAGTHMREHAEPDARETAATIAIARLMFPRMNIQAPPNLSPHDHRLLLAAGINDWGGISPLTSDFVNPEAPWPHVSALAETCRQEGLTLRPRLPIYAEFVERTGFLHPALQDRVRRAATVQGATHVG
jgi:7,8-didemethyl-8-hydroxy-5-deazariboflavin synthase CofG subunit